MTTFRELSRNRDFTVLWVGQTISDLGSRVSSFVYPLIGWALTHSTAWASAVEAAYLLGMVAILLPAGVMADRLDRLRIMRASSAIGVALYASLVVAGLLHHLTIGHLIAVALLTGVAAGLFSPAESSAIRAVVAKEDLPTAFSQQQAREHIASLAGAPLGGVLLALTRWAPFLLDALSYAASWLLLGRIRTDLSAAPGARAKPTRELRDGIAFTWSHPFLRVILVWAPLVNLTMNALFLTAVLRLVQSGTRPTTISLVEIVGGVCGIVGAYFAPRIIQRLPTGVLTILVAWSTLPLVVPMALWNQPAVVAAALGVLLLLNPAGNAGIGAYQTSITPPEVLGRSHSAMRLVGMAAMPVAPLVAGVLLTHLDGRDAMLGIGVLAAVTALIPTLSRSVRAVPRPADWSSREVAAVAR
ncbi:MFS transporter [Nocardioides montaniterrae]